MAEIYIHKMPFKERQNLVDILNCGNAWRDLGGHHLGFSQTDIEKFSRAVYTPGGSPADAMLTHWGTKNHTVLQLFKHLRKMGHYQGMEAIRSLVPEKYQYQIKPQNHSSLQTTHISGISRTLATVQQSVKLPPPPVKYSQAKKSMEANLDFPVEKNYPQTKLNYAYQQQEQTTRSNNVTRKSPEIVPTGNGKQAVNNGAIKKSTAVNINSVKPNGANIHPSSPQIHPGSASVGTSWPSSLPSMLRERNPSGIPVPDPVMYFQNIPIEELKAACNGFHPANVIGRGGFGEVYKGRRHEQDIAVKRIRKDKRLIEDPCYVRIIEQFITELKSMHTFPGENILPIVYYSMSEDFSTEPCIVYQFMENGSVSDRLRRKNDTPPLTWSQRADIALGVAKGLCHLHGVNIIHGDIKAGNVLLDKYFKPYIGDFGLARGGSDSSSISHKTISQVIGTEFYLPDDYKRNHQLHSAVDTFSYGILLFELATGKSPSFQIGKYCMRDLMELATSVTEYVDKNIGMDRWAAILFGFGKDCTQKRRTKRPEMREIKQAFEKLCSVFKQPESLVLQQYYDQKKAVKTGIASNVIPEVLLEDNVIPEIIRESASDSNESQNQDVDSREESSSSQITSDDYTETDESSYDLVDPEELPHVSEVLKSLSIKQNQ